jgi:hypothetical protein
MTTPPKRDGCMHSRQFTLPLCHCHPHCLDIQLLHGSFGHGLGFGMVKYILAPTITINPLTCISFNSLLTYSRLTWMSSSS